MLKLISRKSSKYRHALLPFILAFALLGNSLAQEDNKVSYTRDAVDLNKRSMIEVDPSTLALNITIPLADFPGRGPGVPVTMRYVSKSWRVANTGCFIHPTDPGGPAILEAEAYYAEHSGSGWNTSLGVPYIEWGAEPYTIWFDWRNRMVSTTGSPTYCKDEPYNPCPYPNDCTIYPRPYYINKVRLHLPDGTSHELRQSATAYAFPSQGSGPYVAVDGSRIRYDHSTRTVFFPDGSRYLLDTPTGVDYIDRHGNTLSYNNGTGQWTDTLGRVFNSPPVSIPQFSPSLTAGDYSWALPGVGGANLNYVFRWRNLSDVRTDPSQQLQYYGEWHGNYYQGYTHLSPSLFYSADGSNLKSLWQELFNPVVLHEIQLPNGQKYKFTYNIYGEIDKVYLPTGGYKRYRYEYIPPTSQSVNWGVYSQVNRGVVEMWESASGSGSDEDHWQFSSGPGPFYLFVRNTVTAPDGTRTERDIYNNGTNHAEFGFDLDQRDAVAGRTFEERVYNASGQMIRRVITGWTWDVIPGNSQFIVYPNPYYPFNATHNPRMNGRVEIMLDTGGDALAKATNYSYDADLNVIATNFHDYVSIPQEVGESGSEIPLGALLRTEETTFLVNDPDIPQATVDAYRARNLIALPTKQLVKNGSGTVVAANQYIYDEAAYAPLTNSPAAVQWTNPPAERGTPTTLRRWLNISTNLDNGVTTTYNWEGWESGQWLETHTQTDVCGNVRKMWDARGKMSEIKYDGNFSDGDDHNAYAYPTQTLTPPAYTGGVGGLGIPFGTNQQLTTSAVYDFSTGKVVSAKDANNQTTTYSYANDTMQRLTKITRPTGGGETIYEYNDNPGTTCACDVSVKTRTLQSAGVYVEDYVFFDGLGRTWRAAHGEGGGKWSVTDTQYDDLERVWKVSNPALTGVVSGAPKRSSFPLVTANLTTMTYDVLSRVLTVATPDGSVATTSYSGNEVTVADQANGTPNVITGGQPRNTTRRSVTDGLGRLKQVIEAPGSLGYTTDYTYDALDNLRQVNQSGQNRHFLYDSVGRLARARIPEQDVNAAYDLTDPVTGAGNDQWTLKYAYDENGNLKKRWDARSVVTSYNYDDINRNIQIGYSNGTAGPERYYDGATGGKGRPWRTVSYNNHPITGQVAYQYRETTNYDAMGRPTQGNQQFLNSAVQWVIYSMSRTYDLMGHVTRQTYPSGRKADYSYTAAGRLGGFSGDLGDGVPRTYADQMTYNAAGQMTSERFGTQTQSLYHTMNYNSRHQMYDNKLGTSAGGWNRGLLLTYYSVQARNIGAPHGEYPGNNGNVWMQEHFVPTNDAITTHTIFRDIYEYDDLNRLKRDKGEQKSTTNVWTTPHQQTFNYDQWGNRTIIGGADTFGANINNLQFTVDTATNRLGKPAGSTCAGTKNGMCYDQGGNLIFDNYSPGAAFPAIPGGDREYDGENRMTKGWGTGGWNHYVYDGDGQRVRRVVWEGGFQVEYWHVYDFDGALIAEYLANGLPATTNKENGYRNGQLLLVGGCDVARWIVSDHLGTPRIEVDVTGNLANVRRHDYLAFGEELTVGMGNGSLRSGTMGYAADCVRQRFDAYERDNETGLDYALARYYADLQGRFTSVDPLMESAQVINPQTWNRYSFALNNPLAYIDPDGLNPVFRDYKDLTDDERRILENSKITVGKGKNAQTLSGQQLYDHMKVKQQKQLANFLNQTAVLNTVKFENGRTALSYVNSVSEFKQDRITANVDSGLIGEVRKLASTDASKGTYYVGPEDSSTEHGIYDTSFRENRPKASQQMSFASKLQFGGADIDIDEECPYCGSKAAAVKHGVRVVTHKIFRSKTNPYDIYNRLITQRAIQPSYKNEK